MMVDLLGSPAVSTGISLSSVIVTPPPPAAAAEEETTWARPSARPSTGLNSVIVSPACGSLDQWVTLSSLLPMTSSTVTGIW